MHVCAHVKHASIHLINGSLTLPRTSGCVLIISCAFMSRSSGCFSTNATIADEFRYAGRYGNVIRLFGVEKSKQCNCAESLMLDKMPKSLGRALDGVHADAADLAVAHTELTGKHATIEITSPAFSYNEIMPSKYTAD